jgi:four helix bundle protein
MSNLAIEQEETVDKVLTKSRMKATVNMVNPGNEQEDIRKFSFEEWIKDVRGQALAKQMTASIDSICANIEEGFGRGFGKQLIYFYTVSLGSARETKGRLFRARAFLSPKTLHDRLTLAGEIVALLITEINRQKSL